MNMASKHLILPVETAARELDAKLLLSLHAAGRGITVTLGNYALLSLNIHKLAPGIYLSHNFTSGRDRIIGIARKLGHRVVALDEEGLVWINAEIYRRRRTNKGAMANLEAIFAWGSEQAEALEPVTRGMPVQVILAGNPRADLLRPGMRSLYSERVAALKAEFGDFILINSNFGWINHALARGSTGDGMENLQAAAKKAGFPFEYLKHRYEIYREIVTALPAISQRFPNRHIILRPHPSENDRKWRDISQALPNVTVRYDSDLIPWLLAASHIVHNGCTTAVETALLDRIAISFRPRIVEEHEIPQSHKVSLEARTLEQLIGFLATEGLTDNPPKNRNAILEHMIASMSGPSSSQRIAAALDELFTREVSGPGLWRRLAGRATAMTRKIDKYVEHFDTSAPSNPSYYSHKFPPISAGQIAARLQSIAGLINAEVPEVQQISERVFRISPRGAG